MRVLVRTAALAVAVAVAVLVTPAPAGAHPFGDPQTVTVGSEDGRVVVEWRVGGIDDLTLLGIELGVLPADRVMLDGAITFDEDDPATVAASEELRGYLLERIAVEAGGSGCTGEVTSVADDLQRDGARLEFACEAPATTAQVTVRMLTDLHPAYRTLATGPGGQRAVFDKSAETHDFDVSVEASSPADPTDQPPSDDTAPAPGDTADDDLGRSAALQLGGVLGAVALLALTAVLVVRRRRAAQTHPTTATTNTEETTRVPTPASS